MRTLKTLLFCGALALCPTMARAETSEPAPATNHASTTPSRPAPAAAMPTSDEAEYAARELSAPGLERFEGGASLSITLGTTALIVVAVLVALLIIL
jgi:hypothetical protein